MTELVTGEAVAVELPYARLASRAVAFGLDLMIQGIALAITFALLINESALDGAALVAVLLGVFILVVVGYPATFETLSHGQTLGKMAMGLRVVRDDGGAIRFRHALVRALAGAFVDFWGLGLGGFTALVVSLFSERGKRLGDYLAGTVVIRVRTPRQAVVDRVWMPNRLAGWAASADVNSVPDELALAIRQYLGRSGDLTPDARYELAGKLARRLEKYVQPAPPPDTPTVDYLAAVLAERRRRSQRGSTVSPVPELPEANPPEPAPRQPPENPFQPPA